MDNPTPELRSYLPLFPLKRARAPESNHKKIMNCAHCNNKLTTIAEQRRNIHVDCMDDVDIILSIKCFGYPKIESWMETQVGRTIKSHKNGVTNQDPIVFQCYKCHRFDTGNHMRYNQGSVCDKC